MDKKLITDIIRKFLNGNCSDEEFAYLLYWYESFDENMPLQLTEEERELLRTNILRRIKKNIQELEPVEIETGYVKMRRRKDVWRRGWKYAAAAVVIGIIYWFGFSGPRHKPDNSLLTKMQVQNEAGQVALMNRSNQVRLVILPDSSRVWLNPGSSIRYTDKFTPSERKVQLTGEAFFDIRHDAARPFVAISQNIVTTVLGTSFLIRTGADGTGEVLVLTGKVAVERRNHQRDKIILTARQSAVLNKENKFIKEADVNNVTMQKWQQVNLSFDNVPFAEVIQTLDKRFGVQLYCLDDKIYQYRLNADFNNQNLADILEMLKMSLNINYKMINDSTISFYEKMNLKK
ncbi:MAG: DUF4974 domain-containing protein [Chitinophagaceae bacterium]|nr:MAG: DUF4974 domain-containing protein [Chitinophagaceae bacterium]